MSAILSFMKFSCSSSCSLASRRMNVGLNSLRKYARITAPGWSRHTPEARFEEILAECRNDGHEIQVRISPFHERPDRRTRTRARLADRLRKLRAQIRTGVYCVIRMPRGWRLYPLQEDAFGGLIISVSIQISHYPNSYAFPGALRTSAVSPVSVKLSFSLNGLLR